MALDLTARLRRYRAAGKTPAVTETAHRKNGSSFPKEVSWPGWTPAGCKTLKREFFCGLSLPLPYAFAGPLAILVPDIVRFGRIPRPEELLFFDLETTGLSGGAGTIAFLAAFGRFAAHESGNAVLAITQYLLLDYPGESEFIENAAASLRPKEFAASRDMAGGGFPLVVSYNGKCFDSQILKNRCLINGIRPPEYCHADLLHPSRRLWKKVTGDCSQTAIEVQILGLDRTGDISGALAPEIWFSFLRSGENAGDSQGELLSVCDHNARDVAGLATLFLALEKIASDPVESRNSFKFDDKALALSWWKAVKKRPSFFKGDELCIKTAFSLLEAAAEGGSPQAAIALAKDAEWRLNDFKLALHYTNLALAAPDTTLSFRDEIEKRRLRLEKKKCQNKP